ncbi:MAG TPA: zinc ribbon domain-containing protein [Pyrinomonadaceae bacterium]|nr:zinc ribbon domain-containing protein [Pyrinomonadaceae bacterium]
MATCASCGTNNIDGTKFCVSCGATLASAPAPESWRASGDLNNQPPPADAYTPTGGYTSQTPPPNYPSYNAGQNMTPSYQQQTPTGNQPMHPAVPAIVSFFIPGIGLLFVPNKASLGLGVFGGYVALNIILFVLAVVTLGIGSCLFLAVPLVNVAAAIHSWDEAAKASNGQFQPILFK